MRRFKLFTAALTAVTAIAVSASSGASAANLPYHIFDSFNGTSLNTAVWFPATESPGTAQSVHSGSLELSATSATASGFNDSVLTNCEAVGDFDAQMEFTLSTWPAADNVTLAIVGPSIGNTFVNSQVVGNVWGLFVLQTSGYGYVQIPASVRSGALRLSRRGDEISSYFRTSTGNWQQIGEFIGSTAPTWLGPAIWNTSGPFAGQPVAAQVHWFKVEAAGLTTPSGFPCVA